MPGGVRCSLSACTSARVDAVPGKGAAWPPTCWPVYQLGKALTGERRNPAPAHGAAGVKLHGDGAALGQPLGGCGLALQRHHAAHQPDIAHGLALSPARFPCQWASQRPGARRLQCLRQGVDALRHLSSGCRLPSWASQAFRASRCPWPWCHRVGQALAQAGAWASHHAGGHGLGLVGAAVVGRQAGQPWRSIGQPQAQLGGPGLHALPAFEFAFFSLLRRPWRRPPDRPGLPWPCSFGLGFLFLSPACAAATRPPRRAGARVKRLASLPATAAAPDRACTEICRLGHEHLKLVPPPDTSTCLVGLAAAAMALAPHRIVGGSSVGHLAGDSNPWPPLLLASPGDSISTCAVVSGTRPRRPVRRRGGVACPRSRRFCVCPVPFHPKVLFGALGLQILGANGGGSGLKNIVK